jgi:hypothetical protein
MTAALSSLAASSLPAPDPIRLGELLQAGFAAFDANNHDRALALFGEVLQARLLTRWVPYSLVVT